MSEDLEAGHARQREHRPEDRAAQAEDEEERSQVAEQQVLGHVHEEELLLAEGVERRDQGDEHEGEPGAEADDAPALYRRSALSQRPDPPDVEEPDGERRHDLERLEGPARQQRRSGFHGRSLGAAAQAYSGACTARW